MKQFLISTLVLVFSQLIFTQTIPNLPIPIGGGNAEVWHNNIYYFGGSDSWSGNTIYPRIYKFDGANWSYYDSIPDNKVWDAETILYGDYVYLFGGWPFGSELNRRYDLNTGDWVYLANSPNTNQTYGLTAEEVNGNIYLFNAFGEVFEYNISGDSWTSKTPNTVEGGWGLSSILYQNEVYILGWNDSAFYKYTPSTDSWTQLSVSPYQVDACSFGIMNNLIYAIGGNAGGSSGASYKSMMVYNISSNSWTISSQELSSKRDWMATAEYEGGLYVLGGIDSVDIAVDIVEEMVSQSTQVVNTGMGISEEYSLEQNYPDPFNPSTKIAYSIPSLSFVKLKVYNELGKEIKTLVDEEEPAGNYLVEFDGANLPSGTYFYQLIANNISETKKMILLK
jgi:hypothetical protein